MKLKLKRFIKKHDILLMILAAILIVIIGIIILLIIDPKGKHKEDETNNKPVAVEKIHTMYVKINPLVKLTFKETYTLCKDDDGKEYACGEISTNVMDFELLNDDAKEFYKDLDFKNKKLSDVLLTLCEEARKNNVGFESLEITTDSEVINHDTIVDYLKENNSLELDFTVYVNFKEYINETDILNNDQNNMVTVTFDSNGGSKVDSQTIKKGEMITKPSNPTRKGYIFVEWDLNNKVFDFKTNVFDNITLLAKWKKEESTSNPTENNNSETTSSKTETNNNQTNNDNNSGNNANENQSSTTPSENENNQTDEELKITSTLEKVNLNDNILVHMLSQGLGVNYYYASNFQEVFKDYIYCNSKTGICNRDINKSSVVEKVGEAGFQELIGKLDFDTAKETEVKNAFASLEIPTGVSKEHFHYAFENHELSIEFEELRIFEEEKYGTFGVSYNKLHRDFVIKINTILEDAYIVKLGYGDSGSDSELLTEELCQEYNINCARW